MQEIDYTDQGHLLEASVVRGHQSQTRPTILLFHAWKGKDEFVCDQAKKFAREGYHAIALDVYGKGVLGSSVEENKKLMNPFLEDRELLKRRLLAGVHFAKELPYVDGSNIFVIGFCFGGLCALDVARSGENIKGAASFHGIFLPPNEDRSPIDPKILALHGDLDPMVPREQVKDFKEEMTQRKADWQLISFGGTYHAFTNPEANNPDLGTIYDKVAAKRAFRYFDLFLQELIT